MPKLDRDILLEGGFSGAEISESQKSDQALLREGGFPEEEINEFLGIGEFDQEALDSVFNSVYQTEADKNDVITSGGVNSSDGGEVQEFPEKRNISFTDAIKAGFQQSVTGLILRDKPPDMVLPEGAPVADRITTTASSLVSDAPFLATGALIGGGLGIGAGAEGGPAGSAILGGAGAMGGAFALPAGLRAVLMDSFENGSIDTFGEFWDRVQSTFIETSKGFVLGATTSVAGRFAGAAATGGLARAGAVGTAAPLIANTADYAATVTTLGALGPALEGEVPEMEDFIDAAIVIAGFKAAPKVVRTMRDVYELTGKKPYDIAIDAALDLQIKEDLLAEQFPRAYQDLAKHVEKSDPTARKGATPEQQLEAIDPIARELKKPEITEPESTAVKEILSAVAIGKKGAKPVKFLSTWDSLYKDYIDNLHPLRVLMLKVSKGEEVDVSTDFYKLARLDRGTAGKIVHFFEFGTFNFKDLRLTGNKGLQEILGEIPRKRMDHFRAYMLARRGLELKDRGIKLPKSFSEKNMNDTVMELGKEFDQAFKDISQYQSDVLTYLRDSGVLSTKQFDIIKEANSDYVPFYRYFDTFKGGGRGKGLKVSNPIRRITGSELPIVDPVESIIKNTAMIITMAERNRIGTALSKFADKGEFITRSKRKITRIEVSSKELKKALKPIEEELGHELPETSFPIFRAKGIQVGENEVVYFEKGRPVVLEVPREVAQVFKGMDEQSTNLFVKMASIPASTLRAGAVLAPEFTVRNAIRDTFNATLFSVGGFRPIIDTFRGLASTVKKDEHYRAYVRAGSFNNALAGLERKYVKDSMHTLLRDERKVQNLVRNPLGLLRTMSELIEAAPRVGELRRNIQDPKIATMQDMIDAGFSSREVTLDFARMGANVRAMNMITAFFNAQVQGGDRIARGFKDNPVRSTNKAIASITMPSVLLHMTHYDWAAEGGPKLETWYSDQPDWQKDLFWIMKIGSGENSQIVRIPKPFEAGIFFGTGAEMLMDSIITDDPRGFESMYVGLAKAVMPGVVPTIVTPFVETAFNTSMFTGNPIIPKRLEKLLPEYQFTPYTSELTKSLSRTVARMPNLKERGVASPIVLDTFIRGWSGGLGQHAIALADLALRTAGVQPPLIRASDTLADTPVVKAFVIRHPSMSTQPIGDFYEEFEKSQRRMTTIDTLAKQGRSIEAIRELDIYEDRLLDLSGIREAMSNATAVVRKIEANPEIPRDEKRQMQDELYVSINDIAKMGLELIKQQEEALAEVNK